MLSFVTRADFVAGISRLFLRMEKPYVHREAQDICCVKRSELMQFSNDYSRMY